MPPSSCFSLFLSVSLQASGFFGITASPSPTSACPCASWSVHPDLSITASLCLTLPPLCCQNLTRTLPRLSWSCSFPRCFSPPSPRTDCPHRGAGTCRPGAPGVGDEGSREAQGSRHPALSAQRDSRASHLPARRRLCADALDDVGSPGRAFVSPRPRRLIRLREGRGPLLTAR